MKAKVYQLTAPRRLELLEEEFGTTEMAPDEIEAVTIYTAISPGTELAAWHGKPPLRPSRAYPRLQGYCNLAQVVRVGSNVRDVAEGDHVLTHQSHRSAFRAPAAEVLLSRRNKSDDILRALATTYLYHLGYVTLLSGGYRPGHYVAVVGFGALGYTTASLAAAHGASPVVLTGRAEESKTFVSSAFRVASKALPLCGDIAPPSDLAGFDLVINTSDTWSDYFLSLEVARKGGTVVLLSFPGRGQAAPDQNPLDSRLLYDKQLTIRQAGHTPELDAAPIDVRFTLRRNMRYLAGLLEDSRLDPSPLVTFTARWDRLEDVYEQLGARPAGVQSALLDWRS